MENPIFNLQRTQQSAARERDFILIRQITAELRVRNGNRNRPVANVKYITHTYCTYTLQ